MYLAETGELVQVGPLEIHHDLAEHAALEKWFFGASRIEPIDRDRDRSVAGGDIVQR